MIEGKVVAVTGGSHGIGLAIARLIVSRGGKVVLGATGEDRLKQAVEGIAASGGEAASLSIDVARREDLQKFVELSLRRFGRLDALVSNAGVMPIGPFETFAVEDWERMIDVNLKGVLWGVAAALPVFQAQGSGHFVNVASTAARKTVPNMGVYSASKAAVLALSDGLRQELAGRFRVTVVLPGYTDTSPESHVKDEKLRAGLAQYGRELAMPAQAVAEAVVYALDQPEDVNVGEITVRSRAQP